MTTSAPATPLATRDGRPDDAWRLGGPGAMARLAAPVVGGHGLEVTFADVLGRLVLADDGTPAAVEVRIAAASLDTGEPRRDRHLRSAAFLDTGRYPHLCFRSHRVDPTGAGRWEVHGDLRIRDVSRPVQLQVTYTRRGRQALVRVGGEVDRRDFGLVLNRVVERTFRIGTGLRLEAEIPAVSSPAQPEAVAWPCDPTAGAAAA
ncbi:MAG: YceI family protein [Nitriliruptoraceae bacterium]